MHVNREGVSAERSIFEIVAASSFAAQSRRSHTAGLRPQAKIRHRSGNFRSFCGWKLVYQRKNTVSGREWSNVPLR